MDAEPKAAAAGKTSRATSTGKVTAPNRAAPKRVAGAGKSAPPKPKTGGPKATATPRPASAKGAAPPERSAAAATPSDSTPADERARLREVHDRLRREREARGKSREQAERRQR